MKISYLALSLMAVMPLAAENDWEVGLFAGRQTFYSMSGNATDPASGASVNLSLSPQSKTAFNVRVGRSVYDFGSGNLQVTAAFQPPVTSSVDANVSFNQGTGAGTVSGSVKVGDLKASQLAIGAMVNFNTFVKLGAGLDCRFDNLSGGNGGDSTTIARPWLRGNATWEFQASGFRPFIGLEAAVPLTKYKLPSNLALLTNVETSEVLKTLAPSGQIGIYVGARF